MYYLKEIMLIKQLRKLIADLKEITLNKNLLIFVDQEGGKVQRFDGEVLQNFQLKECLVIFTKLIKKILRISIQIILFNGYGVKEYWS